MRSLSQLSEKLTMAAVACAATRMLGSSIAASSAGSTLACCSSWISGPRSVHSCPVALTAAQRTRGCGSPNLLVSMSAISPVLLRSCLSHPSAICARHVSAAWRCFHSAPARSWFIEGVTAGSMVLPRSEHDRRSRCSCATWKSSLLPASSFSSSSAVCQSGSSSMSSSILRRMLHSSPMYCGILRIMPGAFSRCSHSVTMNSTARWRTPSSKFCSAAICSIAWHTGCSCLRKKRGSVPATSTNISRASCAELSSPALSASMSVDTIAGMRFWNWSRSAGDSSACTKPTVARSAATRTSIAPADSDALSRGCSCAKYGESVSTLYVAICAKMLRATSLRLSAPVTHWKRKPNSSGQAVVPEGLSSGPSSSTARSATVSHTFLRMDGVCSPVSAAVSSVLTAACVCGWSLVNAPSPRTYARRTRIAARERASAAPLVRSTEHSVPASASSACSLHALNTASADDRAWLLGDISALSSCSKFALLASAVCTSLALIARVGDTG
mmetsp:Transcript_6081/g.24217  ORF Transcript_6081/g.24217 Transcript_6081/m.24217 type:complete len:501 (-) Transcript_6081:44-1546(-)